MPVCVLTMLLAMLLIRHVASLMKCAAVFIMMIMLIKTYSLKFDLTMMVVQIRLEQVFVRSRVDDVIFDVQTCLNKVGYILVIHPQYN